MNLLTKQNLFSFITLILPKNPTIVEAGSFDGTDTIQMSTLWPQGNVHAFEPVPEIFNLLIKNSSAYSNVHPYQLALHDRTGIAPFHISEKKSRPGQPFQAGSLCRPKERLNWSPIKYTRTICVETVTIDQWAQVYSIPTIDFIWLDVQGNTLPILKASPNTIKKTTALYVEVEFVEAYEHQYQYKEVINWLHKHNFVEIGRDFSDSTDWFCGNILFVRD